MRTAAGPHDSDGDSLTQDGQSAEPAGFADGQPEQSTDRKDAADDAGRFLRCCEKQPEDRLRAPLYEASRGPMHRMAVGLAAT